LRVKRDYNNFSPYKNSRLRNITQVRNHFGWKIKMEETTWKSRRRGEDEMKTDLKKQVGGYGLNSSGPSIDQRKSPGNTVGISWIYSIERELIVYSRNC
jgi:hypothetical protein